jgi:ABC-type phosphate transport system auxiliary subunit
MSKTGAYLERRISKVAVINYAIRNQKDKIQSDNKQLETMKKEIDLGVSSDDRIKRLQLAYDLGANAVKSYEAEIERLIAQQYKIALELRDLQHLPNFPIKLARQVALHDGTNLI